MDNAALIWAGRRPTRWVQRVLTFAVINDSGIHRAVIRRVLERAFDEHGVSVLEGGTGEDAVSLRFGTPTPMLLIVNWLMPRMDGATAIARIRSRELTEGLPPLPIILESVSLPAVPIAGADASLNSPFSATDLTDIMESLLASALAPRPTNRP